MEMFRSAIRGNEHILVRDIAVDSMFWSMLQSNGILSDDQVDSCTNEVFRSMIVDCGVLLCIYSAFVNIC